MFHRKRYFSKLSCNLKKNFYTNNLNKKARKVFVPLKVNDIYNKF